jgi:uncharacterized lipoprotein YddW (UPF0748 family)
VYGEINQKIPRGSATKAGQTNYDDLYADILLWLEKGWIDYVTPQLYWEHGHALADYDELVQWWNDHSYGRALYIGHGIYRAGTNATWRNPNEIPYQINKLRSLPNTGGSVYLVAIVLRTILMDGTTVYNSIIIKTLHYCHH